jgi:hypothetical protein
MDPLVETVETKLARIAGKQHGVVNRAQLLDAGISDQEIKRRLGKGSLLRVHRGTYRVGHMAWSVEAQYMAAVLACGDGAVLSGRPAGYLFRLLKGSPPLPEVTAPKARRINGVRTRHSRGGDGLATTRYRGIPITTVPQTIVDLAGDLDEGDLARACHEAGVLHKTTPAEVESVLARRSNVRGAGTLKRVMRGEVHVTLSRLERRFVELLTEASLPLPTTNRPAGGRRVDCRWPGRRLTVELDSYTYHRSRHAWEQDRRREREAYARGDDFRRYTRDDVFERPREVLRELRPLVRP